MNVVLVMLRENGERRSFSLTRDVTVIGRREDADFRIPLSDVSRKHCRLIKDGDMLLVEDMGSSNGTYHNGVRVQEADVQAGDSIQIGPVQFIVQIDGVPSEDELLGNSGATSTHLMNNNFGMAAASAAAMGGAEAGEDLIDADDLEVVDDLAPGAAGDLDEIGEFDALPTAGVADAEEELTPFAGVSNEAAATDDDDFVFEEEAAGPAAPADDVVTPETDIITGDDVLTSEDVITSDDSSFADTPIQARPAAPVPPAPPLTADESMAGEIPANEVADASTAGQQAIEEDFEFDVEDLNELPDEFAADSVSGIPADQPASPARAPAPASADSLTEPEAEPLDEVIDADPEPDAVEPAEPGAESGEDFIDIDTDSPNGDDDVLIDFSDPKQK